MSNYERWYMHTARPYSTLDGPTWDTLHIPTILVFRLYDRSGQLADSV